MIDSLEPVVAVLLGVVVFNEPLARTAGLLATQMLGAALAVLGIVLLDRSPVTRETQRWAEADGSRPERFVSKTHLPPG